MDNGLIFVLGWLAIILLWTFKTDLFILLTESLDVVLNRNILHNLINKIGKHDIEIHRKQHYTNEMHIQKMDKTLLIELKIYFPDKKQTDFDKTFIDEWIKSFKVEKYPKKNAKDLFKVN